MRGNCWFELETRPIQQITPPSNSERFEGIDFCASGSVMAVATSETNAVLLFRREANGRFEKRPFQEIASNYPHDISFSRWNDGSLLAIAQRAGAIAIHTRAGSSRDYTAVPEFAIDGPRSKLAYSDGVVFAPPNDKYLAACNLSEGTISFFRRLSLSPAKFRTEPEFELKHEVIYQPDGLAFSNDGKWLAIANHGKNTVTIFRRRRSPFSREISVRSEPVAVISDSQLRYPHSVAFTPQTNHVVVTNAGANYFNVYAPRRHRFTTEWSQSPVAQVIVHDDLSFKEVNMVNKMEGGPKGIAITGSILALCSPQIGVKFYSFREGWR